MTISTFYTTPSFISKAFGDNIQLLPSVDELFEVEMAYLEFNCLSKEQLLERSAFIKSIDNETINNSEKVFIELNNLFEK